LKIGKFVVAVAEAARTADSQLYWG
jgi:hypothetical protein